MKWKTPTRTSWWEQRRSDAAREGETRKYKYFAFVPVRCTDGTTRWFEMVWVHQVWGRIYTGLTGFYEWGWTRTTFRPFEKKEQEYMEDCP